MATFLLDPRPVTSLDEYLAGPVGGLAVARAQELGPAATRAEVAVSGLRGRGGGGFSTGRKWEGVATQPGPRFVVANGAEGEPGTFKDRALLRANPYQFVEGLLVAAFAVEARAAYVCLKATFTREREAVLRAIEELQRAGMCEHCELQVVAGPSEYLFGEEKALLEVIEGGEPLPRWFPPHEHGLFATAPVSGWQGGVARVTEPGAALHASNPTVVNNVETLCNVAHVLARSAAWFRQSGTPASPGTVVVTVVGDVVAPDVGEVEMGTPLADVIAAVGSGLPPGRTVKAVLSGVANPVLTADRLGAPVSYEGFERAGSGLGSAGFIVLDDTACMVQAALRCSRFLAVESCGQCPPCKRGSLEITEHLHRIEAGMGSADDVEAIAGWAERVTDGNRCYLAVEERIVVTSILQAFGAEVAEHLERGCPSPRQLPMWTIADLGGGRVVYDESFWRKQPDWTYLPEDAPSPR